MPEKILFKLDKTNFFSMSRQEEKILRRAFLPLLAFAALAIFLSATAEAASLDPNHFFSIHEVKPILTEKRDFEGQPIAAVNQVDVLVQLPSERVARRIRVPLQDTLFLDPRAPARRTFDAVIGLDGQVEK